MKPKHFLVLLFLLAGFFILSVILWLKVDYLPIRLWDEARNAVNAIEMHQSGDWLVRTFNNQPETYNLKPPLLTWLQAACLSLFGYTEIAIRFPSILASIATLFLVFLFVYKETRSVSFAFLSAGITATSSGFYGEHVGRFGDHDALLVFFCTLLFYAFWQYQKTNKNSWLYISGLAICLGILTKSISILLFMPALLICLIINKKLLAILNSKHFCNVAIGTTIPVILYYVFREFKQPGFWSLVWNDELFPRYFNSSENLEFAQESFWYYADLLPVQFNFWLYLLPIVFVAILFAKNKSVFYYLLLLSLSFFVIISKGTKNFWYDAPIFPLLAILVSLSLFVVVSKLIKSELTHITLVLILLYIPYKTAYNEVIGTSETYYNWETYGISYYLKDNDKTKNLSSNNHILLDNKYGFEPHLFYVKKLEVEQGIKLNRKLSHEVNVNDTLLITHLSTLDSLESKFDIERLDSINSFTRRVVLRQTQE